MKQLDIFKQRRGRARNTDPDTSHEAAETVDATKLEIKVLDALRTGRQLHTQEIADLVDEPRDSISPRMKPLEERGYVHRVGRRDRRIVWAIGP